MSYGITVWGATHMQYLSPVLVSQERVRAMTFSDPFAHSLPLFSDLQILKHIYHLYLTSFVYECYNKLSPSHFSDYFTQVSDIHHHNTSSAFHGDFFLRERTLYSMVYALCVLMELKFGITSLLISETLHQLQTSRKKSKNCFWSLITQQFEYACSLWYSLS